MEGHDTRIRQLLTRYAEGQLDREEFEELFDWLHRIQGEQLPGLDTIWEAAGAENIPVATRGELFDRIKKDPRYGNRPPPRLLARRWSYAAVAAAIIVCCGLAIRFHLHLLGNLSRRSQRFPRGVLHSLPLNVRLPNQIRYFLD